MHDRLPAAAVLAAVCAACSPVAGVLLALAGLTHALVVRSPRSLLVLGVPPAWWWGRWRACSARGGGSPTRCSRSWRRRGDRGVPGGAAGAGSGCCGSVAWCTSRRAWRAWRCTPRWAPTWSATGCCSRGRCCCARCMVAARTAARGGTAACRARPARARWRSAAAVWRCGHRRVDGVGAGARNGGGGGQRSRRAPPTTLPVERFVASARAGSTVRVEVPFTRGHWEAAWLAPKVSLAQGLGEAAGRALRRGAARQRSDGGAVSPAGCDAEAVRLCGAAGRAAGSLERRRGPADRGGAALPARSGAHAALADLRSAPRHPARAGAGHAHAVGHDWFSLRARTAGRFTVRVRYTRYFTVTAGAACVGGRRAAGRR